MEILLRIMQHTMELIQSLVQLLQHNYNYETLTFFLTTILCYNTATLPCRHQCLQSPVKIKIGVCNTSFVSNIIFACKQILGS